MELSCVVLIFRDPCRLRCLWQLFWFRRPPSATGKSGTPDQVRGDEEEGFFFPFPGVMVFAGFGASAFAFGFALLVFAASTFGAAFIRSAKLASMQVRRKARSGMMARSEIREKEMRRLYRWWSMNRHILMSM